MAGMLKLRDANVLLIKEFANKNISISSLLLSLGIRQHKIVHLNSPTEALNRSFHQQFDILICDQSFRNGQVKSQDLIFELKKANAVDERSTIVMDCKRGFVRDRSYYLADVHITPDDNQQDISDLIRKVFKKKNKVWPLLQTENLDSHNDIEKRYQFFERHYIDYQHDLRLNRANHHLLNRELKQASELYGVLIKEGGKRDSSVEISLFLNTLVLNSQTEEALELYEKFDSTRFQLGQPFEEIGSLLLLKSGHVKQAYQLAARSGLQWGLSRVQHQILALFAIGLGKYEDALVHFSSDLNAAKQINQNVVHSTLNYLFALLMVWMRSEEGRILYEKKFAQVLNEVSRLKMNESETQHFTLIQLHADFLKGERQNAEASLDAFVRKLDKANDIGKIHALFLSTGLSDRENLAQILDHIKHNDSVFMFEPLPSLCAALVKHIDFQEFAKEMKRFHRTELSES
ncbi:hypothetical protein [Vibrio rotiferianus]|uniref:hypothetical protein n=1 Tax=Vibrio rotiferianus TaxID=190895 RepID=UPI0015F6E856|nr:hypothetical protein [Vibrio rotiferianus]